VEQELDGYDLPDLGGFVKLRRFEAQRSTEIETKYNAKAHSLLTEIEKTCEKPRAADFGPSIARLTEEQRCLPEQKSNELKLLGDHFESLRKIYKTREQSAQERKKTRNTTKKSKSSVNNVPGAEEPVAEEPMAAEREEPMAEELEEPMAGRSEVITFDHDEEPTPEPLPAKALVPAPAAAPVAVDAGVIDDGGMLVEEDPMPAAAPAAGDAGVMNIDDEPEPLVEEEPLPAAEPTTTVNDLLAQLANYKK
jgi:hypothetical protein